MRWIIPAVIFALPLFSFLGCGMSYKTTGFGEVVDRPDRLQNRKIELSAVPQIPRKDYFAPPNRFHKGYWSVIVDGQVCVEQITFENENRIMACLRLAEKAAREGTKVTVKGKLSRGILEIEHFQDIKTDTPWYKDQSPHYGHPTYLYNWGGYRPYYWWSAYYYGAPYQPMSRHEF